MALHQTAAEYNVRGVPVSFPFSPYPSQLVFMERVIEALQAEKRNALLESPTGTGKTLCLLCACLAWRSMQRAHRQAEMLGARPATAPDAKMLQMLAAGACGEASAAPLPSDFGGASACRIIYMSRTHGQLSQVVRELRNTTYRPNISVLGSRQQYCVHHDVKKVPAGQRQNAQCQKLVGTQSCLYHRNVMDHKYQHKEVLTDCMDIEDLVKHGEKHKVCPYYLTRDTANDADVIFMPYNYLTDPGSRRSLSQLWKDSIVIFDEAHNMESICSEAASFDLTASDIAMCIMEVDRCTSIKESGMELTTTEPATEEELTILKLILKEFENALAAVALTGSPASATKPGSFIMELFESAGVMSSNAAELVGLLSKAIGMLSEAQGASIQNNPSLKKFHDALEAVFKTSDFANLSRLYKIHITEEPERKGRRAAPQSITDLQPSIASALRSGQKPRQIGYWCFSAGVTMKEIVDQGVRNVLLASGTLSPMASWAVEMQMRFEVTLENSHVIGDNQLFAAVVKKGPAGAALNSSYKNRDNVQTIDELGNLILNISRIVPPNSGVLVFFPSYAALTSYTERWRNGTLWERINGHKQIFVEPRESGAFKMTVNAYTDEVDRVGSNGAMLMAVCRGKMSEGIDFADRHGRAVIVTGIPFPAYYDPRVVLKRSFMDELAPQARSEGREPVTGEQWYVQQAARAVNQAIGRVIRHRKDYGVILLCDERFAGWTKESLLSKWMKDKVEIMESFGPVAGKVSQFFAMHKQAECSASSDHSNHGAHAGAGESSGGQVAIHGRPVPAVKARRQEHHKIATAFPYEEEYLSHKDKQRDVHPGMSVVPGGGLGSWMSSCDDEPSHRTNAPMAVKIAEKPQSLADRLVSMHSGASQSSRQTPQNSSRRHSGNGAGLAGAARVSVQAATPVTIARTGRQPPAAMPTSGADGKQCSAASAERANGAGDGAGGARATPSAAQAVSKTDPRDFMASIRHKLSREDYVRFKKAVTALKGDDEQRRCKAFDELHAILGKQSNEHVLAEFLTYLSRKLREQMREHLAGKGVSVSVSLD